MLLALGEPEDYSGESQSRTQIVVPAAQQKLAEEVAQCGKPVVPLHETKSFRGTLPETNSSHLKIDGWKTIISLWGRLGCFGCQFQEGLL